MGMLPPPAKLFSQEVEKDASLRLCDRILPAGADAKINSREGPKDASLRLCDKNRTPKRSAVFCIKFGVERVKAVQVMSCTA